MRLQSSACKYIYSTFHSESTSETEQHLPSLLASYPRVVYLTTDQSFVGDLHFVRRTCLGNRSLVFHIYLRRHDRPQFPGVSTEKCWPSRPIRTLFSFDTDDTSFVWFSWNRDSIYIYFLISTCYGCQRRWLSGVHEARTHRGIPSLGLIPWTWKIRKEYSGKSFFIYFIYHSEKTKGGASHIHPDIQASDQNFLQARICGGVLPRMLRVEGWDGERWNIKIDQTQEKFECEIRCTWINKRRMRNPEGMNTNNIFLISLEPGFAKFPRNIRTLSLTTNLFTF